MKLFITILFSLLLTGVSFADTNPPTKLNVRHFDLPTSAEVGSLNHLIFVMRGASSNDHLIFHFNGVGGSLGAGLPFISAMESTKAKVSCVIDGYALSLYAAIALKCKELVVPDHSILMFHAPQGSVSSLRNAERRSFFKIIRAVLTDSELKLLADIPEYELYLTGEEFKDRLKKMRR